MKTFLAIVALTALTVLAEPPLKGGNFGASRKNSPPVTKSEAEPRKVKSYPFHGALDSVSPDGSNIKLRGKTKLRAITISARTRIYRGEEKASLKSAVPGERVTGSVHRNAQGQEEALTIHLGGKSVKSRE